MKKESLLKSPWRFAAVGGLFWALALFFGTLLAAATGYGSSFLNLVAGIYPGYAISFSGALAGSFFGFMDGFVICYLIAFFSGGKRQRRDKREEIK
ncbi:MAG TPA: hypothetical protein VMD74_03045 [Candidatus Methylomirabilis sp.]|nr:hypothetical protein [Candidatus Methylomirabilis sp.]